MHSFKHRLGALALAAALGLGLAGCGAPAPDIAPLETPAPAATPAPEPAASEEYRAVWVSYLEFSSMAWDSAEAFAASAAALMDDCAALGLNTVILQVRPFADALYPSELFPWHHGITGAQGTDPGYDPLAIMVEAAHARGLRLEAWINPYRVALNETLPGALAENSLAHTHPEWVKQVGGGLYLEPSDPGVQDYICRGVAEIVENYEVDGIHFDDYFYPTTDPAFDEAEYSASGQSLPLADWRRRNVNELVAAVYQTIKSIRPACRFGISPQGNNDNNYNSQYSDVALWLATPGYVDYIMPQVYWGYGYTTKGGSTAYAYENVTARWAEMERCGAVDLYFGLGAYRIGDGDGGSYEHAVDQWNTGHQLADMVTTLRGLDCGGFALYRYNFLSESFSPYPELAAAERSALQAVLAG